MNEHVVVCVEPSSEFSPNPLTEVIQAGAQKLLRTAIQAEFLDFIDQHSDLIDKKGHKRLIRHGSLPERKIMTAIGAIPVQVPRIRDRGANKDGTKIKFRSSLVSQYSRKKKPIEELFSWLYLKGILTGDFSEALKSLPGLDGQELSPSTINRLKATWREEHENWRKRDLKNKHYAYIWVNEIYFTSCVSANRQCILIMVGVDEHGKKDVLTAMNGARQNTDNWRDMLKDIKTRGLIVPLEFSIGNVAPGFQVALHTVYPETRKYQIYKKANAAYDRFIKACGMKYEKTIIGLSKIHGGLLALLTKHWEHIDFTNLIRSTFTTFWDQTQKVRCCLDHKTVVAITSKLGLATNRKWQQEPGSTSFPKVNQDVISGNSLEFVAQLCQEYWKLAVATERAVEQMPERAGRRLTGRVTFSKRQLDVLMQEMKLRFVDFAGEQFYPGLAVSIDNVTDYKDEESLVISKTLEPTVMSDMVVIRLGRATVAPVKQEKE